MIFRIRQRTISLDVVRDLFHFLHHLRWGYGGEIAVFGHTLLLEVFRQRVGVDYYGSLIWRIKVEWLLLKLWDLVAITCSLFLALRALDDLLRHVGEAGFGFENLMVHLASGEAALLARVAVRTPVEMIKVQILLRSNILADFVLEGLVQLLHIRVASEDHVAVDDLLSHAVVRHRALSRLLPGFVDAVDVEDGDLLFFAGLLLDCFEIQIVQLLLVNFLAVAVYELVWESEILLAEIRVGRAGHRTLGK